MRQYVVAVAYLGFHKGGQIFALPSKGGAMADLAKK